MCKEEFDEIIYNKAVDYAYSIIEDPEDHLDTVDGVISDFMAGAENAWELLQ